MSAGRLTQEMVAKYSQPEELAAWREIVVEGLSPHEEIYIDRHFRPGECLLDIGCGGGRESIALSRRSFAVVGVDLVHGLLAAAAAGARQSGIDVPYAVMNAAALGFAGECFDGVLMLAQVLACIPYRENRLRALAEARRVLRPGGRLVLTSHCRNSHWKYRLYFAVMDPLRWAGRAVGLPLLQSGDRFATVIGSATSRGRHYLHMYSREEMAQDLAAAGFRLIECHSRRDLHENRLDSPGRENDYYLIYAAEKPL
jgi:SAM-dependent methyltransferase